VPGRKSGVGTTAGREIGDRGRLAHHIRFIVVMVCLLTGQSIVRYRGQCFGGLPIAPCLLYLFVPPRDELDLLLDLGVSGRRCVGLKSLPETSLLPQARGADP
jgi:hypothetical protein